MQVNYTIEKITKKDEATLSSLAALTVDVVKQGASLGFMDSFTVEESTLFWENVFTRVEAGKVVLLVARDANSSDVLGTVQLVVDQMPNQPHRADVSKMHVHSDVRRLGIGEKLLQAIEEEAHKKAKHILVLDTVTDSPASYLYQKLGWVKVGDIPEYALFPDGMYCSTTYFYKKLK